VRAVCGESSVLVELPAEKMACPLLRRVTFVKSAATRYAPHAFHQPKTHRRWLVFLGCHGFLSAAKPVSYRFCIYRELECGNFGAKTGTDSASNLLSRLPCTTVELPAPTFLSGAAAKGEVETVQHFHPGKMLHPIRVAVIWSFFIPKPREEIKEP